jgi:glycosyltransferase involved in cell wall biosynthesis|tara:strand:- start:3726 stop:4637 length:912 start_codon:yes stop_codon:yes gene_type:complete
MPDVTVVIPAFNEAAEIAATVKGYDESLRDDQRIIVVDDCSEDDTATLAQSAGAEVITLPERSGASAARNAGARLADTEYVLFSDAHIKPPADWFGIMRPVFDAFTKVGAVGPVIYDRDDTPDTGGAGMALRTWAPVGMVADWFTPTQPIEVPIVTSAAQLWRTKTFWDIGGYDPDFNPIGLEDVEISLRAWRHGYANIATPRTAFGHRFKESWSEHDSTQVIANELRVCVLHWSNDRLAETLKLLADDPRFDELITLAFSPSTLANRARYQNGLGLRDTDAWLAESIPADSWTLDDIRAAAE